MSATPIYNTILFSHDVYLVYILSSQESARFLFPEAKGDKYIKWENLYPPTQNVYFLFNGSNLV